MSGIENKIQISNSYHSLIKSKSGDELDKELEILRKIKEQYFKSILEGSGYLLRAAQERENLREICEKIDLVREELFGRTQESIRKKYTEKFKNYSGFL